MTKTPCTQCGRPVSDDAPLCHECGRGLAADLRDLPNLISELTTTRAGQTRAGERVGGASAETPVPVRISSRGRLIGEHLVRDLELDLIGWTRDIAALHDCSPAMHTAHLVDLVHELRGRGRTDNLPPGPALADVVEDPAGLGTVPASVTEQCAVWLAAHVADVRRHPDSGRLALRLCDRIEQLRCAVDPPPTHWVGTCTATGEDGRGCGTPLRVITDSNATTVRCSVCRTHHVIADLQAAARGEAEDLLATIPELLRVTRRLGKPIPKATLYWWAQHSHIQCRGWQHGARITDHQVDPADKPVYRLGDVLTRAAKAEHEPADDETPKPKRRGRKGTAA